MEKNHQITYLYILTILTNPNDSVFLVSPMVECLVLIVKLPPLSWFSIGSSLPSFHHSIAFECPVS